MKNGPQRLFTAFRARNWRRLVGPIIGACVLAMLLATSVGADTTPTTYYACVNMKSGSIYMVNAGDTCKNGYMPISWNQVGPQGPQGPAGPTQTLRVQMVEGDTIFIQPGQSDFTFAACPVGTFVTGGGFVGDGVYSSAPDVNENEWLVAASNTGSSVSSLEAWAVCASLA